MFCQQNSCFLSLISRKSVEAEIRDYASARLDREFKKKKKRFKVNHLNLVIKADAGTARPYGAYGPPICMIRVKKG